MFLKPSQTIYIIVLPPTRVWKSNNNAKKFNPHAAELYRSAFTLRQRMMNAVQNIGYYMMIEVVEPNWHAFLEKMKTVENVDEVLAVHQNFIDSCLKNCMLTDANLQRTSSKLFKVCVKFCDFIQVRMGPLFTWALKNFFLDI